jgi:hypothetical protein
VSPSISEFDSFRAELKSLVDLVGQLQSRTVRDDVVLERFRTLFRVWVSTIEPHVKPRAKNTGEVFKLAAELERLAQLSAKYKPVSEYRKRLRAAVQLADALAIYLPPSQPTQVKDGGSEQFLPAIPDLPLSLVPSSILGWKSRMQAFCREHPFERSVFIMVRYRTRTASLIKAASASLSAQGLFGVVASEQDITDDLYNPIACLFCCSRGIAIFDRAEERQAFNPNVAYELGMLHLLSRRCLLLKHSSLPTLQTDILMKLYQSFSNRADVARLTTEWIRRISEDTSAASP